MNKDTTVLVTGASGFLGIHCVVALLKEGYQVRGTIRSLKKEPSLRETIAKLTDGDERLTLVEADLLKDEGWYEAAQGCDYVMHVASPFPLGEPEHEDDLIIPAREGTLRVLKAAAENKVKRVVLTSSIAAIGSGHPDEKTHFDESDWSPVDSPTIGAYPKSKMLAEKAAWDFIESLPEEGRMELAVINPGLILGPLPDTNARTSGVLVQTLMEGNVPGLARMHFNAVDVRDVASAHIQAMTNPEAAGQRFACVADSFWMEDVANVLKEAYPDYSIRTTVFPNWVVRLVALFSKEARATVDSLDKERSLDNSRIKETFNWQPHDMKEMVLAMADSMIELKMV